MNASTPRDTTTANVEFNQLGKPLTRTDAAGKVFGTTPFAGDYAMPQMLHLQVVRSTVASAKLLKLNTEKARALDGVVEILTADDLPNPSATPHFHKAYGEKRPMTDPPLLVGDRIRFFGEPLAVIAAETSEIAAKACALVEAEYEPVQGVYDPQEALQPGASIVHGEDNVMVERNIRKGDVAAGFEKADLIVENTYRTPFQEHAFLEPEVGLAWVDETGVINIRTCAQDIEHFRMIADVLDLPHNRVRIRGAFVGGGFGGKEECAREVYMALLALKTGRPVRLEYTREDSFVGHGKRHPMILRYKTGVTKDGKICALDVDILADSGAYLYLSANVLLYAAVAAPGPYKVDNLKVCARAVATNNMYTSAFRGYGAMQACAAYEQQMDEVAKAVGMDPIAFRQQNFLKTGDPISTGFIPPGAIWTGQCVDRAWAALGPRAEPVEPHIKIGRGVAAYQQSYGKVSFLGDTSEVWVGVEFDGSVVVRSGVADVGGGQVSSLAQIAAEVLGVSLDDVTIYKTDSAVTPLAGRTAATRTLSMTGNATKKAAEAIRGRLLDRAALEFGVESSEVLLSDGRVLVGNSPDKSMILGDLVRLCHIEGIQASELAMHCATHADLLDMETGQGQAHPDYTYGAHAIELSVDTETGEVRVLKSIGAHDVGQCINRSAVEGQIEGGAQNGQGYALSEEMLYQEGKLMTPSLSEYLMPTSMDMTEVESIILESRSGVGPFGAKGIGEPAISAVAPAIANAVTDAIDVRIFELPMTPERIVNALMERGS